MNKELHKLRGREAELESQIKDEKRECDLRMENLERLALHLSDCKKAIEQLSVVAEQNAL
jgi:SMC interacting uncharacterized protein involved in chromosome segregation